MKRTEILFKLIAYITLPIIGYIALMYLLVLTGNYTIFVVIPFFIGVIIGITGIYQDYMDELNRLKYKYKSIKNK